MHKGCLWPACPADAGISLTYCETQTYPNPDAADTAMNKWFFTQAFEITKIACVVDPADTGESVTITLAESDANGDPGSVVKAGLVCGNTTTTEVSITDAEIAIDRWVSIDPTAKTGTVSLLTVTLCGTY